MSADVRCENRMLRLLSLQVPAVANVKPNEAVGFRSTSFRGRASFSRSKNRWRITNETRYRDDTMREFFKGWRRKVGCVLLVMACVISAMWLRSHSRLDLVEFWDGEVQDNLYSTDGSLHWSTEKKDLTTRTLRSLPYWSVVLTLTSLAGCLILWKPRSKEARDA